MDLGQYFSIEPYLQFMNQTIANKYRHLEYLLSDPESTSDSLKVSLDKLTEDVRIHLQVQVLDTSQKINTIVVFNYYHNPGMTPVIVWVLADYISDFADLMHCSTWVNCMEEEVMEWIEEHSPSPTESNVGAVEATTGTETVVEDNHEQIVIHEETQEEWDLLTAQIDPQYR